MRTILFLLVLIMSHNGAAYQVVCENESSCPGWIAGVSRFDGGVCSSFLVKKNIVATNLHCIPESLRTGEMPNVSCKNKIKVFFPKTDRFKEQEVDCEKVIYTSVSLKEGTISTDFAFLELAQEVSREVLEINQDGISDQAKVKIVKVDPAFPKGIIRTIECTASQNTPFNPYFKDNYSPLVLMYGCPIMKGNSGSPLVSSSGKAVGILSAMMDVPFNMSQFEFIKRSLVRTALGTNFSCLNTFFLGYNIGYKSSCLVAIDSYSQAKYRDALTQSVFKAAEERFRIEANKSLEEFAKENSIVFAWKGSARIPNQHEMSLGRVTMLEVEPRCLIPGSIGKLSGGLSFRIPSFTMIEGVDDRLKYQLKVEKLEGVVKYTSLSGQNPQAPPYPIELESTNSLGAVTRKVLRLPDCVSVPH